MKSKPSAARGAHLDSRQERDVLAAIGGWLSEEGRRDFDARLAADEALAREFERRQAAWSAIVDPPEVRLPWGFGRRLAAKALAERAADRELARDWRTAPGWARLAAAAALVCGVAFGWALAPGASAIPPVTAQVVVDFESTGQSDAETADLLGVEELLGDSAPSLWEALASGDDTAGSS